MARDRHSTLGSKVGPRLAHLVAQANVHTLRKSLHLRHQLAMHVFEDASNMIGGEYKAAAGDLLEEMARHPATPPHMARLLRLAAAGQGQGGAISAAMMLGGGAVSSFSTILSNLLYPAAAGQIARDPNLPPAAETIALLVARGLMDYDHGQSDAAGQGRPPDYFEREVEAARSWPDVTVILELWRRGEIQAAEASHLLQRLGMPSEVFGPILALKRQYLAPADAALGMLRGSLSEARAHEAARVAGLEPDDFETLVENTGEPPPLEELLSLWRRGKIDTAKLDHGIRQSRVRNEWIETVHELGIIPPSPQEAIHALLQGQISRGEAERRWKEGGGDPTWFQHAFDAEGSAPSPVELGEMANRGIIPWEGTGPDVTSFHQGFLEGPWRNKWRDSFRRLAVYRPPPRTIPTLYKSGAIGKHEAIHLLREAGLDQSLAEAYVVSASGEKVKKAKDIAESAVIELYRDRAIDRTQAVAMLGDLGYDHHEADFLIVIAELARVKRYTETAISTTHSRYTGHAITRSEASNDLDKLGVPAHQREELLGLWDLERADKVKHLTAAEVHKAVKKDLLTPEEGLHRLERMGYPTEDAEIYLKL